MKLGFHGNRCGCLHAVTEASPVGGKINSTDRRRAVLRVSVATREKLRNRKWSIHMHWIRTFDMQACPLAGCYSPWARWITSNPNPSTATNDERSRPAMPSSVSSACNQVKSMDRHIDGRARIGDPSGGNKRARESTWIEDVHNGNQKSRFRANSNIII